MRTDPASEPSDVAVQLASVRRELEELTQVRLLFPLVGRMAQRYAELCEVERTLLKRAHEVAAA